MFIKIREDLTKVIREIEKANKNNKVCNNHVRISQREDKAILTLMENNKEVLEIENDKFNKLFAYRDNYVGILDTDKALLNVVTSIRLHGHTGYSLLDGLIRLPDLVQKTQYSCAITDHGVLYGVIDFYKKMKASHKKAIIGFEAYSTSLDGKMDKNHLVLLAKNEKGYLNLVKLCSFAQKNKGGKFPQRPQITHEQLEKYSEGVICLSACVGGEIPQAILNGDLTLAKTLVTKFKAIFGEDFYIEMQRHYIDNVKNGISEEEVNNKLIELAREFNVKLVATDDAHYLNPEDNIAHQSHLCNQTKTTMSDPARMVFSGKDYHVHTCEEMEKKFADIPEALINTLEVMDKCKFEFEFGNYKLPYFEKPKGYSDAEYLAKVAWEGFEQRFPKGTCENSSSEYRERLQYELDVICKMGYPNYFLIVWDYVKHCIENGIAVGPGRGSACGSLVAYVLSITNLNPIPYNLLFERFLNPDRVSMPDIDLDFNHIRREDVIEYCRKKYGTDSVSKIITFGTLGAKSSILDMSRVWDKPVAFARKITKLIPSTPNITLKKALEEVSELKNLYDTDKEVKDIIDKAKKVEGLPKNTSIHACGLVISPSEIVNYCPQVYILNEETGLLEGTTQFTMGECEEIGLLKMDFLGLKTMTVLQESVDDINKIHGLNMGIDDIPINDIHVYEHISKGNTKGIFQLEGAGMTSFMKQLFQDVSKEITKIKSLPLSKEGKDEACNELGNELFERIIAGISLYRPGPIDEIPNYIQCMLNPNKVKYDTPELEPILKTTYGILVYQEQVMQTVRELAGFSKGQADTIRKSMGKKIQEILDEYKPYFINGSGDKVDTKTKQPLNIKGCTHNDIEEEVAKIIWDKMETFAKYAFNKSHAAGYGVMSVKTAWLSYYYPVIFMKANLNTYISNPKKVKPYLAYCTKMGINMLKPSVNKSDKMFSVEGDDIRFGLKGIKNVGTSSGLIIKERNIRGEFKSYQNFVERMNIHQKINKNAIESLIFAGALDEFEGTRKAKIEVLDKLVDRAKVDKKVEQSGQMTMFDLADSLGITSLKEIKEIKTPNLNEFEKDFMLLKEEECAGFFITEHPLDDYADILEEEGVIDIATLTEVDESESESESELFDIEDSNPYLGQTLKVAGVISDLEIKYSRKTGKPFVIFNLKDKTGDLKSVCFNKEKMKNEEKLIEGKKVIITGKFDCDDFGCQISVKNIQDLSSNKEVAKSISVISSVNVYMARQQWKNLVDLAINNEGCTKINFIKNGQIFEFPKTINLTWETLNRLQMMFGEKNCKLDAA